MMKQYTLLTKDAITIITMFKKTGSALTMATKNRQKRGIITITKGLAALACKGINAYFNCAMP